MTGWNVISTKIAPAARQTRILVYEELLWSITQRKNTVSIIVKMIMKSVQRFEMMWCYGPF